MGAMFGPEADLSGLIHSGEHLYINDVFHRTTIEINEHLTEAASATGEIIRI